MSVTVNVPAVNPISAPVELTEHSDEAGLIDDDATMGLFAQTMEATPLRVPISTMGTLLVFYLIGVGIKAISLFSHLLSIRLRLIRNTRNETVNGVKVLVSDRWGQSFSLLNTIVLTEKDYANPNRHMLINHELAHVRQRHSLDLLLAQLFVTLHWFNPLAYMYRKTLRGVHEYLADSQVVDTGTDPIIYQQFILQCISNAVSPQVANTFSAKLIKNRFAMMLPNHKRSSSAKYLLFVPALAGLFFLFSFKVKENVVYQYEDIPEVEVTTPTPALEVETQVDIQTQKPQAEADAEQAVESTPEQPSLSINAPAMAPQDSALLHQKLDRLLEENYNKLITLSSMGIENPLFSEFTYSLGSNTELFVAIATLASPLPELSLINVESNNKVEPERIQGSDTQSLIRFKIASGGEYKLLHHSEQPLGPHAVSLATHKETGVNAEVGIGMLGKTVPLKSSGTGKPKISGNIKMYHHKNEGEDEDSGSYTKVTTTQIIDKENDGKQQKVIEEDKTADKVGNNTSSSGISKISSASGQPKDVDYIFYSIAYPNITQEMRTTDSEEKRKFVKEFRDNSQILQIGESVASEDMWPHGYIQRNIQYPKSYKPKKSNYDMVEVQFQLSETAQISDVKVLQGINPEVDTELVRVVESMPGWIPKSERATGLFVPVIITLKFNLVK